MKLCPLINGECIGDKCLSFSLKPIISYINVGSRLPLKPVKDSEIKFCTALNLELP